MHRRCGFHVKTLVLGGVRSGKSRYAEALASRSAGAVTLIATGTAGDEEMATRIAAHRARRAATWTVVEEPLHLAGALARTATPGTVVVVDCLTLWLTNLLCHADPAILDTELEALVESLPNLPGNQVFVGNEVGFGIMPINDLARRFGDAAGILHQRLAALCDFVVLMVAGLPLTVKGSESGLQSISRGAR
jgi:adenosylcobinamide kinase/adenosylcobinamide-phosphate guanylyltransferase